MNIYLFTAHKHDFATTVTGQWIIRFPDCHRVSQMARRKVAITKVGLVIFKLFFYFPSNLGAIVWTENFNKNNQIVNVKGFPLE